MNTPAPISSAAGIVTVKVITSFHRFTGRAVPGCYPIPKLRYCLRRSQRERNRHFSHAVAPSAASAPHAHCRPLRHPFNLCPMLITSRQHSLAFGKVRSSAKNAASPDTIGSGKRRVSFRATPTHSSGDGAARLYSVFRPGPCRIQSSTGRGPYVFNLLTDGYVARSA
jgi:hypothetical protein